MDIKHFSIKRIIECVAKLVIPLISALLILFLIVGCSCVKNPDSDYLAFFQQIEDSSYLSVYSIDPEYIKESIIASSEKMDLSSGSVVILKMLTGSDSSIVTLGKWIREAESMECSDKLLRESKACLVEEMKDEVRLADGIVELMNESIQGMPREEILERMDELYGKGEYRSSRFEKAKQKIELYAE